MSSIAIKRTPAALLVRNTHHSSSRYLSTTRRCQYQEQNTTPPPRPKRHPFATLAVSSAIALGAYTFGSIYPPTPLSILFPRPAPAPPNPDSPEAQAYTERLEAELQTLPALQEHRLRADAKDWYEVRPYQNFPEERRVNNLTAGALRGPGKLALPPLVRAKRDESESVIFIHLGRGLCGHDGIVHGGLLATLLDETLARTAISNLPEKVGVTAKLGLNYRAPTRADQWVVIKINLLETKGRKAMVSGRIENLNGTLLVEATATFVQPRYAKLLQTAQLRQAMGEAPKSDEPVLLADGENIGKLGMHVEQK
ncbi:HotDog domain-containing protein [Crucibulum laeve]|uniref:HotDog domain-containing protein n=1 Tax=Crucibulum laeve TaxID=68775 RepID=A0A5C3LKZ5_9AGAR|nr:HotDog domain-containing protein [Crucibulum laeve]